MQIHPILANVNILPLMSALKSNQYLSLLDIYGSQLNGAGLRSLAVGSNGSSQFTATDLQYICTALSNNKTSKKNFLINIGFVDYWLVY
jgi:hypothetical protein